MIYVTIGSVFVIYRNSLVPRRSSCLQLHGTISYYFINCSAQRARDKQTVTLFQYQLAMDITVNLFHHNTLYQCCVSALNQAGVSTPLCKLIITSEAGKTRVSLAIITGFLFINLLPYCMHTLSRP